ncbi:hypothetical protein NIES2107_75880 (plasmid) [Nostoc carneum NIES-2107]|nr:hypothetical protein NIES2107_75880 [Nostoc carneum NIES-2107]
MQVVYNRCAGLDVHKKTVVACVITPKSSSGWHKEIRTFTTMTQDLLKLSDWLTSHCGFADLMKFSERNNQGFGVFVSD